MQPSAAKVGVSSTPLSPSSSSMVRTYRNRRRRAARYSSAVTARPDDRNSCDETWNSLMCSSAHPRPSDATCSAVVTVNQSRSGSPSMKNPSASRQEIVVFITSAKALTAWWNALSTPSGSGPKGDVRSAAMTRNGRPSSRDMWARNSFVGAVGSPATGPAMTSKRSRRSSLDVAKGPSVE